MFRHFSFLNKAIHGENLFKMYFSINHLVDFLSYELPILLFIFSILLKRRHQFRFSRLGRFPGIERDDRLFNVLDIIIFGLQDSILKTNGIQILILIIHGF